MNKKVQRNPIRFLCTMGLRHTSRAYANVKKDRPTDGESSVYVCYQIIWNNQIVGNKICRKVFAFLSCRFALTIYTHAIHYYIYTAVFVFLPLCHIHTHYTERKTAAKVCKLS